LKKKIILTSLALKSQILGMFMNIKSNTDYFRTHYYPIAFCNPDGECLLRGTD
jgi:hypothetical protein